MERVTSAPSLDVEALMFQFLFCSVWTHWNISAGATFPFHSDLLFTFFKVFEGLFLKVLEQI